MAGGDYRIVDISTKVKLKANISREIKTLAKTLKLSETKTMSLAIRHFYLIDKLIRKKPLISLATEIRLTTMFLIKTS